MRLFWAPLLLAAVVTSAESLEGPRFSNLGSPYVALDSWVYPAFDRLAALGYAPSAFLGMRPWTRAECARILEEAADLEGDDTSEQVATLLRALRAEFQDELNGLRPERRLALDSVYWRTLSIQGKPLTDAYHFGQTLTDDFGRPFQEGFNHVGGAAVHAVAGPFVAYLRGEYQHAPEAPPLPERARQAMTATGHMVAGVPPAIPFPSIDRLELLDAYVGVGVRDWQLTFGRQSLWWGPGQGSPMMFSNNIAPITMLRLNRVMPFKFPGFLSWVGPARIEGFLGRLGGHEFIFTPSGLVGEFGKSLDKQPFIHGQFLGFKPTPNLEVAFFRTTIFGGEGYPFTTRTLGRSLFSGGNEFAGDPKKPGDRRSGLSFAYRLPRMRNRATFYGDGFTEDQFSPIAYADRSVWRSGLYLAQVPRIDRLDLRVEGVFTDNPLGGNVCCGYFYYNSTWRNGYTHRGNMIGNWIGRQGQGAQAWTTYHFTPQDTLQLFYRRQKISRELLPEGGSVTNFGFRAQRMLGPTLNLSGSLQYERWKIPDLAITSTSNVTSSVQLTWRPEGASWRKQARAIP